MKHLGFMPLADSWPMILCVQDYLWRYHYSHLTIVYLSREIYGGTVTDALPLDCCFFHKTHVMLDKPPFIDHYLSLANVSHAGQMNLIIC